MDKYSAWMRYVTKDDEETKQVLNSIYGTRTPEDLPKVSYSNFYDPKRFERDDVFKLFKLPEIKRVVFNEPATIVFWSDNTKTVVKCQDGDIYDPEKGLAMAIAKKYLGNKGSYCNEFKKWLPVEAIYPKVVMPAEVKNPLLESFIDAIVHKKKAGEENAE